MQMIAWYCMNSAEIKPVFSKSDTMLHLTDHVPLIAEYRMLAKSHASCCSNSDPEVHGLILLNCTLMNNPEAIWIHGRILINVCPIHFITVLIWLYISIKQPAYWLTHTDYTTVSCTCIYKKYTLHIAKKGAYRSDCDQPIRWIRWIHNEILPAWHTLQNLGGLDQNPP